MKVVGKFKAHNNLYLRRFNCAAADFAVNRLLLYLFLSRIFWGKEFTGSNLHVGLSKSDFIIMLIPAKFDLIYG